MKGGNGATNGSEVTLRRAGVRKPPEKTSREVREVRKVLKKT